VCGDAALDLAVWCMVAVAWPLMFARTSDSYETVGFGSISSHADLLTTFFVVETA